MTSSAPVLLLALLGGSAWATPAVEVAEDGGVQGHVMVAASPDAVLALLSDPVAVHQLTGSEGTVAARSDGKCLLSDEYHPHPLASVRYSLRVCPDSTGVSATLAKSEDLLAYESRWQLSAAPGGTRVDYTLAVVPDLPLPRWAIDRSTKSSVVELMEKLAAHFGG